MEENTTSKNRKKVSFNWKLIPVIIVVLASLGLAGYFYNDAQNAKEQTPEATQARNLEETEGVIASLSNILLINSEQEPTVARVEDPAVLQESNPDFYRDIVVGDYLVLYPQRAIVYRATENKIINIAPIINTDQLTQQQEAQATQPSVEGSEEVPQ